MPLEERWEDELRGREVCTFPNVVEAFIIALESYRRLG